MVIRKDFLLVILFVCLIYISGCAAREADFKQHKEDAVKSAAIRDWDSAYRNLEDALVDKDPALRKSALDIVTQEPNVRAAAVNSFSFESLKKSLATWGIDSGYAREKLRLEYFSKFATSEEIKAAAENLEKVRRDLAIEKNVVDHRTAELMVTNTVFNAFSLDSQNEFKKRFPTLLVVDSRAVGKISGSQVLNLSTSGTNSAARLGSAVGQAAFIDNTVGRGGYSVMGQITAGIVGAAIGGGFDKAPTTEFLISYSIALHDNSVIRLDQASSDGISKPNGQCVFMSNINPAPHYLCEDSVSSFLNRVRLLGSADSPAGAGPSSRVKCRVDAVGLVEVEKNECLKAGGIVVD